MANKIDSTVAAIISMVDFIERGTSNNRHKELIDDEFVDGAWDRHAYLAIKDAIGPLYYKVKKGIYLSHLYDNECLVCAFIDSDKDHTTVNGIHPNGVIQPFSVITLYNDEMSTRYHIVLIYNNFNKAKSHYWYLRSISYNIILHTVKEIAEDSYMITMLDLYIGVKFNLITPDELSRHVIQSRLYDAELIESLSVAYTFDNIQLFNKLKSMDRFSNIEAVRAFTSSIEILDEEIKYE